MSATHVRSNALCFMSVCNVITLRAQRKSQKLYSFKFSFGNKTYLRWATVVAQSTTRLLLIPENPGSNPVIGNSYWTIIFLLTVCRKYEKEEGSVNGPFLNYR